MAISRRQFLAASATGLCAPWLGGCAQTKHSAPARRLNLFSWADYLHPEAIPEFERRYGIEVTFDTFASNEALLARLEAGSADYDVIVPTNYAVSKLRKLNLLREIDHARIPNYANLMERFRHLSYDPGNQFAIPYTFGTTGVAFNKNAFLKKTPADWECFFDPGLSGRITLLEDSRETLGFALKRRNFSYNSVVPEELDMACRDLEEQKKLLMCYTSDQVITYLASGDALLSLAFSGDAHQARRSNADVGYIIPASGASMWIDSMCIPRTAPHIESAYAWINYILEPKVAAALTDFTYYPTPNEPGLKLVKPELLDDKTLYPPDALLDKCEEIADIGSGIFLYDRTWTRLKCV